MLGAGKSGEAQTMCRRLFCSFILWALFVSCSYAASPKVPAGKAESNYPFASGNDRAAQEAIALALKSLGFGSLPSLPKQHIGFNIVEAKQDYRRPTPDLCCHTLTPLRIGGFTFEKGVGAHANGRIVLRLKEPFRRFVAFVGVDNNWDTKGGRGSVVFSVQVDGRTVFKSGVCRSGDGPVKVEVSLSGAKQLALIVNDAGDGYFYDQADWAEAYLEKTDGSKVFLSDGLSFRPCPFFETPPVDFKYDGLNFRELSKKWDKRIEPLKRRPRGGTFQQIVWHDPQTGFTCRLSAVWYPDPPAVEIGWHFKAGDQPSGLITDLPSLNLRAPSRPGATVLLSSTGGLAGSLKDPPDRLGFALSRTPLGRKRLAVRGGRSSNGDLPFFLLQEGTSGWGVACAIGWSGQWFCEAAFQNGRVSLCAGMEPVRFRLPPGEEISLPRVLIVPFRGSEKRGANLLRRTLQRYLRPELGGGKIPPPVSFNTWFIFGNNVNETLLRTLAEAAAPLGIEYFCLDAGWFEGAFPHGVGNWTVDRRKFPGGLKPVADYAHRLGLKFGLWFEPERVGPKSRWARLHPDLVSGGLLYLGTAEARKIVVETLSRLITEIGVDWIRYDFNMDPLPAWEKLEGPEEKGLCQIRHINGLYKVLDELMKRHPRLLIEQCAGGGRRIDLETVRRGHTFWKSDQTRDRDVLRFHQTGGNMFLPGGLLNINCGPFDSEGDLLGLFAGTLGFGLDLRRLSEAQREMLRKVIGAYKKVRNLIDQDYYELFEQSKDPKDWCGWEFIRPDGCEGFFVVYRPASSPYAASELTLEGLRPEKFYLIERLPAGGHLRLPASTLAGRFKVTLGRGEAQVWRFRLQER